MPVVANGSLHKLVVNAVAGPLKTGKVELKKNWLEQLKGRAAAAKRPHVSQNQRQTDQDAAAPCAGETLRLWWTFLAVEQDNGV